MVAGMPIEFFPAAGSSSDAISAARRTVATPADVDRYGDGTGDRHPWYTGDSPFGGPIAPALALPLEVYRDLGWYLPNLIGNLHAKQEWDLFAPMPLGAPVRTRSTIVGRYRKRNRDYVVNEVLITDDDGRWLQRSRTHQSFLADDPGDAMVVDRSASGGRSAASSRRPPATPCLAFAAWSASRCARRSRGPVRNYHTDREMARALGFPTSSCRGMLSVC